MWQVKSEKEGEVYHLIVDEEVTVGRKFCDIIIKDDKSVSRKHSMLRVSYPISNLGDLKFKPVLTLKDNSSKYGTFVNGKLTDGHGTILKHGDLITFGQCGSNFKVSYTSMVVTTSCMESSEKSALKEVIRKIGGHVVDEWNTECTHLAMSKVKVTVKTVCALVSKKPIVLGEYFKMLLESYKNRKEPENPDKFLPPVNEVLLTDNTNFNVDSKREQLFKEKVFVFVSVQQYKKLHLPITLAGGKTVLMNRSRCDVTPELLLSSCVIQCPVAKENSNTQSQSQTCSAKEIEDIVDLLQTHNKRLIPESDIGLAIVHCTTQQYCNPNYHFDKTQSTFLSNEHFKIQSQTLSQNFVYAPETLVSTQAADEDVKLTCESSLKSRSENTGIVKEIPSSLKSTNGITSERNATTSLSLCETIERPIFNSPKMEYSSKLFGPEKPSTSKTTSISFETTGDTSTNSVISDINFLRSKRSLEDENKKNAKREKLDLLESKSVNPYDIKVEPLSPPLQEIAHNTKENESIFDADTQPSSQTLFKDESPDTEIKPNEKVPDLSSAASSIKRQRNNSDSESNKKLRLSHEPPEKTSVNKIDANNSCSPLGYLNSKLSVKNSPPIRDQTDANEDFLCRSLRIVKIVDLVVSRPPLRNKSNVALDSTSINFKKFKKSCHAGANRMPTIIGGCDLIVHTCNQNLSELNDMLLNQETQNTQPSMGATGNTSFQANFTKRAKFK